MGWDKSDFIVAGMCPVYLNIKELDAFLGPGSDCTKPHSWTHSWGQGLVVQSPIFDSTGFIYLWCAGRLYRKNQLGLLGQSWWL